MCNAKRFFVRLILWLLFVGACTFVTHAQSSPGTNNNAQGGNIVYGVVPGATSPAMAMAQVLRVVHNSCGERPQVGKVFRVRGTNSDAVFFTVVNHPQGSRQVAGMLIAAPSGPNKVEAAMVSDDAARFNSTMNPLLSKLFSEWHPGGGGQTPSSAVGGASAPPEPLRRVVNQDGTASVAIPAGWTLKGSGGTTLVMGLNGNVLINLNLARLATNPTYNQRFGGATGMTAKIVFPSNVDPVRGFPGLMKEFWRVNNSNIDFRIARIEQVQAPAGQRCVDAAGHGLLIPLGKTPPDIAEKDMPEMEALLCSTAPGPMGNYMVTLSISEVAANLADKERATVGAVLSSYQVNEALVGQQANAMAAPAIAAIHQIGAQATARMNATEQANDAQHAAWEAGQDNNARQGQGFSNYILDQTVVQDNNMYGNGTIGHGTAWNSEADALVKANPNRFEIVNTPGYWQGVDY